MPLFISDCIICSTSLVSEVRSTAAISSSLWSVSMSSPLPSPLCDSVVAGETGLAERYEVSCSAKELTVSLCLEVSPKIESSCEEHSVVVITKNKQTKNKNKHNYYKQKCERTIVTSLILRTAISLASLFFLPAIGRSFILRLGKDATESCRKKRMQ